MDNLPSRGLNQSSVNHLSRSLEILTGYGAWEWDIVSGNVHWFGVSEQLIGSLPERSNGNIQDFTDILHPDDRTRVWQRLNSLMARHQIPYTDEYRFILPDGSVRWMSGTGRFYYDDAGKAVRMTGVVQDITERKRAQEASRENEERFAKAFRASPHPIGITEAATGRCIEVNDACLELFGFRREEVIGNTTLMLGIWPNREDRARLVERLQTGEPVRNLELSFKTKSGDVRHILVSSDLAELNGTLCLITVGNDITERKRAEAKLHESEERLRLAQSAANIGTFDWDLQAQAIIWSAETERMWGLPVGGFGGTYQHWRQQIHPHDLVEAERTIRLSLENPGNPYKCEHRIIRPDGTVRWVHANVTTQCDTASRPIRMIGVNFDITERKEAEARLREREVLFRSVFEHAGTGIAIVNLYNGSAQCNPAYCAMLGYTEGEIQHLDFSQVVHPDDRDANLARTKRLLTEEFPYFEIENRYVHKNGQPVWVHKFVSLLRDHRGRPKSLVALATDITERKQAETKLRESEARFRNVFEHAGTGIAISDLDGNIVQCNPAFCAMLGYTEDELLQVHFSELVHVEDRDANLAEIKRLLTGKLPYFEIENRYVHKNGEPVWVRKFVSLLRDDEGRPKYVLVLVTDITERRKTEQELQQAKEHLQRWAVELERVVNEKTAELVHSQARLRSLAGELSLAEQRERKRLAGELHDHLQQLLVLGKLIIGQGKQSVAGNAGCKTLLQRVDDILSEALTYSRTLVTELSPPVLRDHGLGAGLKWLGAYMKKHGQTVTVKVPEGEEIQLSEDQVILLFQSVRELLINSSKHAGTDQAAITMELVDGSLCITVSDEGAGFDLAAAAAAAAPHPSGGLSSKFGLFSIQERMRAMRGKFDLHSVPGEGTTATLMLPLTESAEMKVLSTESEGIPQSTRSVRGTQHS